MSFPSIMKYADVCPVLRKRTVSSRKTIDLSVCSLFYLNSMTTSKQPNGGSFYRSLYHFIIRFSETLQLSIAFIETNWRYEISSGQRVQNRCCFHGFILGFWLLRPCFIAKMNAYSLFTAARELMNSYPNQMMQRVNISSFRSSWEILNKEKPQCSILGPLLFNVLMNNMFLFRTHVICIITLMITPW